MSANLPIEKPDRNSALDFTKGALVLFMLLYHWLNYFVTTKGFYYGYLRFVTNSFILITGFLITNVYLPQFGQAPKKVVKRLLIRGLKLLALFTALNLGVGMVVSRNYNGAAIGVDNFINNAPSIYGIGKGEAAAFEILVPIAYLLLVGPLVLLATRRFKYALPGMCAIVFAAVLILGMQGISSSNLNLFAVGALGLTFGCLPIDLIDQVAARRVWIIVAYVLYLIAITFLPTPYPMQLVGACLSVLLIYSVGVKCGGDGFVQRHVILLGQYSLLAYLAQIAVLQLLRRLLGGTGPDAFRWALSLVGGLLLMSGAVLLVNSIKAKSRIANGMYRLVFG